MILSSNAMHYLLRLLQTAVALFETELEQSGRTAVRIRPNAGDELISQVHTAMQMYRARTELSADGLADLEQLFAAAPYPVTRATETMYQATVTWLLLHEVGRAIGDMAGLAPPARWFLDALPFALDEERYKRWADELSADFNASRHPPVAYVSRT